MTICDMGPIKRLLSFLTHPWLFAWRSLETEEARHSCPPPPNHHLCQDCCVMASQWHSGLSLWAPDASDTVAAKYRKWGPGDGIESNQVYWAGGDLLLRAVDIFDPHTTLFTYHHSQRKVSSSSGCLTRLPFPYCQNHWNQTKANPAIKWLSQT